MLTPDALTMMDVIARTGSFAAAARELGKVPSSLTYSVRQLEDALDVLLFDRRSRQARLTAAGEELLSEGRRLLEQMDAVANRVKRVATGWETQLSIAADGVISRLTMFELCEAFYALTPSGAHGRAAGAPAAASRARRTRHPVAAAHRSDGGHLGGADDRPGRSGDWCRHRPRPGARRPDEGVGHDALPVRGRAAPSAGRGDRAHQRHRADAASRGRGRRSRRTSAPPYRKTPT